MSTTTLEAETLAAKHDLPATNVNGDPLTLCRNHRDRPIYAVADLGAHRDLCADCRTETCARCRVTIAPLGPNRIWRDAHPGEDFTPREWVDAANNKASHEPSWHEHSPHAPASVMDMTGRPADADVTRAQIGQGVLMACGARDLVKDDANGLLMFRVGPNGRKRLRKVLVRLMPNDTYAVEYGTTSTDPFADDFCEWRVVEQETGIYADRLAETVRRLGDRERY